MLGVEMHTTIKTLWEKGYNKSQIADMLQINRKTVRQVLQKFDTNTPIERKVQPSILDAHKEYINIQVNKDLSAKRIFQDLQRDFDFKGSYDTVKRYVAKIKVIQPKAFMVLHSLPGEESQVDFGYVGTIKVNARAKKAWIFVMSLSYSRYMYVQIVFDQSVKTFIECHKNAFKYFGGVPQIIKIDNLKAAILQADFYQPVIQKKYAAFASYYSFCAEPCRVYTPTDKGKVEANVHYVKDNCFKGREFKDIEEAQEFLITWLNNTANVRIHGTTKKIPSEVFHTLEKTKLIPLPKEDYILSEMTKCTVGTQCHITYKTNYYSVPFAYIGQEVDVIEMNNLIKIFYKEKEIATHLLAKDISGQHITCKEHYPHSKNISSQEILSNQKEKMAAIGPGALEFFNQFVTSVAHKKYDYRSISGILSLEKTYGKEVLENACIRAHSYGAYSYKVVKSICQKHILDLPLSKIESYTNPQITGITRDAYLYNKLIDLGELKS